MQRIFKVTTILLFISVLLVSCGGVTPVPTSTPTSTITPRPSATLAPSQIPTSSPTPIPTSTPTSSLLAFQPTSSPDMDVSQYKLRPWLEQDYGYILNNMDEYQEALEVPYFTLDDYMAVIQSERLLRFPDSQELDNRLWEMLLTKPDLKFARGIQPGQDLMGFLITRLLDQGIPITDLKTELEKHEKLLIDILEIPNLLGTGEDGAAIQITANGAMDRLMAVYAVTLNNGKYQVEAITPWMATNGLGWGLYYDLYSIGDTNHNGISEFVIQQQTDISGTPTGGSETVLHAEWSEDGKRFSITRIPVFHQLCDELGDGPCEGDWQFSSIDSKSTLITHSRWFTRGECPELVIQRNSVWDGKQYSLGKPLIVQPQDDNSLQCNLAWAEAASSMRELLDEEDPVEPGWKNDQLVSIVEQSVENWTPQMDEIWGPAGLDYFKLRLAIWHDLRGEDERANEILEELASRTNMENSSFITRMANTYLLARSRQGKTQACIALQNAYSEAFFSEIAPERSVYNNDELSLEHWGVVEWKGSLCDTNDMLSSDISELNGTTPKDIRNFLKKSGGSIYHDEHSDLNKDDIKDYLALVEFNDSDNIEAWAFLNTDGGMKAQLMYSFYSEDNKPKLKVRSIQTGDELIHLIRVDNELIFAQFLADRSLKIILDEYGVRDFNLIDDAFPIKVVINIDDFYGGQETKSYQWESSTQEFVLLDNVFVSAQTDIEEMFYIRQDYSGAIQYIDQFLSSAPPETRDWYECVLDVCKYYPEWYVPYFRYLRGLAYEQLEEDDQAKQAYYELWTDFPNSIFGVAASLKLELVNP